MVTPETEEACGQVGLNPGDELSPLQILSVLWHGKKRGRIKHSAAKNISNKEQ